MENKTPAGDYLFGCVGCLLVLGLQLVLRGVFALPVSLLVFWGLKLAGYSIPFMTVFIVTLGALLVASFFGW